MNLCDLKRGTRAVVLKVEQTAVVRARLRALGIYAGAKVVLLKVSLFKRTYLVQTGNNNKVALGRDVASGVRVWKTA